MLSDRGNGTRRKKGLGFEGKADVVAQKTEKMVMCEKIWRKVHSNILDSSVDAASAEPSAGLRVWPRRYCRRVSSYEGSVTLQLHVRRGEDGVQIEKCLHPVADGRCFLFFSLPFGYVCLISTSRMTMFFLFSSNPLSRFECGVFRIPSIDLAAFSLFSHKHFNHVVPNQSS